MNPTSNQNNKTAMIIGAIVVIVVAALIIYFVARKPKAPAEQTPVVSTTTTTATTPRPGTKPGLTVTTEPTTTITPASEGKLMTFDSSKLGFSFVYPSTWGTAEQKITKLEASDSFEYSISFTKQSGVTISGKSYSYQKVGTKTRTMDLTADTVAESVCETNPSEKVATEDNVAGVYVRGESLNETGGCTGAKDFQYAVFDINRTAKNVVFVANKSVSKDDLIAVVRTLTF